MFIVPLSFSPPALTLDNTAAQQNTAPATGTPFADVFEQAFKNVEETQKQSQQDSYDLAMGRVDNIYNVMINAEKATAALELTVQLTNRAVNAYKEISQMQV